MRNVLFFTIIFLSLVCCKPKEQKDMDAIYESFKSNLALDSLSVAAVSEAELIAEVHYDTSKRKEAKSWLSRYKIHKKISEQELAREKFDKLLFLERNLKLDKVLYTKEQCNFMQQHILARSYTDNKDSLTLALRIITDSLFGSIPYSNECVKNVRCGVYIYKKVKDFEVDGVRYWFAMGTRITGEQANVQFMDWGKYQ